jgi:hypothetical protein
MKDGTVRINGVTHYWDGGPTTTSDSLPPVEPVNTLGQRLNPYWPIAGIVRDDPTCSDWRQLRRFIAAEAARHPGADGRSELAVYIRGDAYCA